MKTPLAQNAFLHAKRSSLLVALAAAVLAGCGGNGAPKASTSSPNIKLDSKSTAALLGSSVTFSASVSDPGSTATTYQWFLNNRAIVNNATATTPKLTIESVAKGDVGNYTLQATGEFGTSTSKAITLTLQDEGSPQITTQPTSQNVSAGGTATFAVSATANVPPGGSQDDLGPLTYQWYLNGVAVDGATNSTFTITNVPGTDNGATVYVVVKNKIDSVQSATVNLTVASASAPAITSQPSSHPANQGAQTSFGVTASGQAPLTYQWYHNTGSGFVAVSDPQSFSTYTISPTQRADAGLYHVVVTNSLGSATSSDARLSVVLVPIITVQPQSQPIVNGSATLSVTAFGLATSPTALETGTLTYQWYNSSNTVVSTSRTFTTSTEGTYYVVVSTPAGRTTSASATLIAPPKITAQPVKRTVGVGSTATFTVGATGSTAGGTLTYQWYKNGAKVTSADGSGGTTATFTTVATTRSGGAASNGDEYYVIVSNNAGGAQSNTVALTVREAPFFTTQPTDLTLKKGSAATINVKADSSDGATLITYQLWVNNVQVATAGSDGKFTYTPSLDAGAYQAYVIAVNDGVITTKSNTVTYTITN